MVRLSLRAVSVYGKKVASSLRASEAEFNQQCSCPPGESCSVQITELPGRRFEAVVTRPGTVTETEHWSAMTSVSGMYRRLFDKRVTAQRIRDAVAAMVGANLGSKVEEETPLPSTTELNFVVVNAETLRQARELIFGCQVCSPSAEIPFDSILDRVTGLDPAATQYILPEGAMKCPRCRRHVSESTLVEFEPPPDSEDFVD